jgi:hypothetical protein
VAGTRLKSGQYDSADSALVRGINGQRGDGADLRADPARDLRRHEEAGAQVFSQQISPFEHETYLETV